MGHEKPQTKTQAWAMPALCGRLKSGDFRVLVAEDPNKVQAIVSPEIILLVQINPRRDFQKAWNSPLGTS